MWNGRLFIAYDTQVENADEPDIKIMSQVYMPIKTK